MHGSGGKSLHRNNIHGTIRYVENTYGLPTGLSIPVLKLIAEGYTQKETADILTVSAKPAVNHQINISEKLDLPTIAGLIKFAVQMGVGKIDTK
jgi:two-component system response regulator NreC